MATTKSDKGIENVSKEMAEKVKSTRYFPVLQKLQKIRKQMDSEILKMQGHLFRAITEESDEEHINEDLREVEDLFKSVVGNGVRGTERESEEETIEKGRESTSQRRKRKKYIARQKNERSLREALHMAMKSGKEMTVQEIINKIHDEDLFRSKSKFFAASVNNRLNDDPDIHKVKYGVYVYSPKKENRKKAS